MSAVEFTYIERAIPHQDLVRKTTILGDLIFLQRYYFRTNPSVPSICGLRRPMSYGAKRAGQCGAINPAQLLLVGSDIPVYPTSNCLVRCAPPLTYCSRILWYHRTFNPQARY
jgi:hypothetical protein